MHTNFGLMRELNLRNFLALSNGWMSVCKCNNTYSTNTASIIVTTHIRLCRFVEHAQT